MIITDMLKASLRAIGAYKTGNSLDAGDAADALDALRIMLADWFSEGIFVFASVLESHTLSSGTAAYTIGDGGDIKTIRPTRILGGYIRESGHDYPVDPIKEGQYRAIPEKSTQGRPEYLFYQPSYPLGQINLYSTPDQAYALWFWSEKPLDEIGPEQDINFEASSRAAVKWNLAINLAPEKGRRVTPELAALAKDSRNRLISVNAARQVEPVRLNTPFTGGAGYDINADN